MVAPLVGFPGVNLVGTSIKLAQQNYGEHIKVIKSIVERFQPDVIFPLMDLSVEANAIGRYTLFPLNESATIVTENFCAEEISTIENVDVLLDSRLFGYTETMRRMNASLSKSVMKGAYVTGPYTLVGLLMGAQNAAMATIINPDELLQICEFTTSVIKKYVNALIENGA